MNCGSEQGCRALLTEIVAGNAGFVYDWCRKYAMIHDKRMFAERAFFCSDAHRPLAAGQGLIGDVVVPGVQGEVEVVARPQGGHRPYELVSWHPFF